MSKVHIELDLEVVQQAVHAKVQPAVEKILATVDLPALIERVLLKAPGGWTGKQKSKNAARHD